MVITYLEKKRISNIINEWSRAPFILCVNFLHWLAKKTGLSYEAINVLVFCVLWPSVTIGMAVSILALV
jgi:hypothetical protein